MAAITIPVINEKDYHLFRDIGVASEFPVDYSSFLEMFNSEMERTIDKGIITIKKEIDYSGFMTWFGRGRWATYQDLFFYAANIIES